MKANTILYEVCSVTRTGPAKLEMVVKTIKSFADKFYSNPESRMFTFELNADFADLVSEGDIFKNVFYTDKKIETRKDFENMKALGTRVEIKTKNTGLWHLVSHT